MIEIIVSISNKIFNIIMNKLKQTQKIGDYQLVSTWEKELTYELHSYLRDYNELHCR